MGFDYLARLQGRPLGAQRRCALAQACDFGSLRDRFYDEGKLDAIEHRLLRNCLRGAETSRYIRELRKAERGRPILSASDQKLACATAAYRKSVIRLSLRWLEAMSGGSIERVKFNSIVNLVCLMQLADDLLDWKEDQATGCPSYVTAVLERRDIRIGKQLRSRADSLVRRAVVAARRDSAAVPFALAGMATWVFVVALIKFRFPQ